ncbi:helix-turn-helix domain-containing protein, partial [Enterococcus faecium]|uniref:helix-turn-helix domain-containing protein n=1 Tax=Enterococcus faecium TaxID=1352 RepID=UPI0034E943C8
TLSKPVVFIKKDNKSKCKFCNHDFAILSNMKENKRMIEIDIGPVLKRIRYERGLTLQKLSRLTDDKVLPSNISRIESAGAGATLKTLTTLANALGTSPSDILREAEGGDKVIT